MSLTKKSLVAANTTNCLTKYKHNNMSKWALHTCGGGWPPGKNAGLTWAAGWDVGGMPCCIACCWGIMPGAIAPGAPGIPGAGPKLLGGIAMGCCWGGKPKGGQMKIFSQKETYLYSILQNKVHSDSKQQIHQVFRITKL